MQMPFYDLSIIKGCSGSTIGSSRDCSEVRSMCPYKCGSHSLLAHVAAPAAAAKSLQSCPTLCDPIDSSPPGSPVPGILQARTLEWVATSFSKEQDRVLLKEKNCLDAIAARRLRWYLKFPDFMSSGHINLLVFHLAEKESHEPTVSYGLPLHV